MSVTAAGTTGSPSPPDMAQRTSECELAVTRSFDAPPHRVFQAWTEATLFRQWWVPRSLGLTLLSCELDVRVGGTYRLVFQHPAGDEPMAFHGTYVEVAPPSRLVWTNEEAGGSAQVTTVTLEDDGGRTGLVLRERYPSKAALDAAIASGSACGDMSEVFGQLDGLLDGLLAAASRAPGGA